MQFWTTEHTAEIILFESARKYLKEYLEESKTLNISKWKSEIGTLRKEENTLYSKIIDIRKEVEQAESVRSCIEKLLIRLLKVDFMLQVEKDNNLLLLFL